MSTRSVTPAVAAPVPVVTPFRGGTLQRQGMCGQHKLGSAECEPCKKNSMILQRYPRASAEPAGVPSLVPDVVRSLGQTLDRDTQAFFEACFDRDFSQAPGIWNDILEMPYRPTMAA